MLFLPEAVYEARRRLLKQKESGKLSEEEFCRRLLELDPHDNLPLIQLGFAAERAEDFATAESYYWRAADSHPWDHRPYLALSRVLKSSPDSEALGSGLAELGLRKVSFDSEALQRLDAQELPLDIPGLEPFRDLRPHEQVFLFAEAFATVRDRESEEVTDRLRPHRLAHDVQEWHVLDAATVDSIVAEGVRVVPLLLGLLRGYAQNYFDAEDSVERALALLGEIGEPSVLGDIAEFTDVDTDAISGAAVWAIHRILEQDPEGAAKVLFQIAPDLELASRTAFAMSILRRPELDPAGAILVRLAADLKRLSRNERDEFTPFLLHVLMSGRGSTAVVRAREILAGNANLLSGVMREVCQDLIRRFESGEDPAIPVDPRNDYTVYEICAGEADWTIDEEDEVESVDEGRLMAPPPPRRSRVPGRNDPCWCGSGKKYKKCHLQADERAGRAG